MKFDIIIGNPPYQLEDGGASSSATPIYHHFISKAIELNPKYISMVVPSRWFTGGKGLSDFREIMLVDKRMRKIVDYRRATDLFPSVGIHGGINYFLWDRNHDGKCEIVNINKGKKNTSHRFLKEDDLDIFINDNLLFNIAKKAEDSNVERFSELVSPRDPYWLNKPASLSRVKGEGEVPVYDFTGKGYINSEDTVGRWDYHYKNKLFISFAYGGVGDARILNKPIIPEEDAICSGTYLTIGPFKNSEEVKNAATYMETKFFRALVSALKRTQHGTKKVYKLVPIQDFSKPWTDDELYKKYELTEEEISHIEDSIAEVYKSTQLESTEASLDTAE